MYTLEKITRIGKVNDLTVHTNENEYFEVTERKRIEFYLKESKRPFILDVYEKNFQWFPLHVYHGASMREIMYVSDSYVCPLCECFVKIETDFNQFFVTPKHCEPFNHRLDELFQELLIFKNNLRLRMQIEFPNSIRN